MNHQSFENQVFSNLTRGTQKTGRSTTAFTKLVFSVDSLRKEGAKVTVARGKVALANLSLTQITKLRTAMSVGGAFDLDLGEDIRDFEPEEGLIFKSSSPLWVLNQTSATSVILTRTCK